MSQQTAVCPLPAHQAGLYREPGMHAHYVEYRLNPSADVAAIKQALAQALVPVSEGYVAVAFGADCWERLQPSWRPDDLVSFTGVQGEFSMPASQADILFWVHGEDRGDVMAAVLHIEQAMSDVARVVLDISGFKNKASRDLTGFVDGTANPKEAQRIAAAQIAAGRPGAGGSYVFSQQWQHNLAAFSELPVRQQEQVIGRTKRDNIELEGDAMPPDSHVSRTDVKVDGVAMKIYRRSTPYYCSEQDKGLYFLCFASELRRIQIQLERMVGCSGDGLSDRLMHYSTAVSGSYWFMPAAGDLLQLLKDVDAGL